MYIDGYIFIKTVELCHALLRQGLDLKMSQLRPIISLSRRHYSDVTEVPPHEFNLGEFLSIYYLLDLMWKWL